LYYVIQNVSGLKVNATKNDNITGTLTIETMKDGQIIASNSTSEASGTVSIQIGNYKQLNIKNVLLK
jgi:hypothetical protein